jgi:ribosomal protein S18 acetylase RimI-like enzyme
MKEAVTIRLLQSADYDAAYQLWLDGAGMGLRALDDSREGIEKFLKRNPRTCLAAEASGELVAVILCGHDGRRAFIYHAMVKEQFRGQGIGRKLVAAVETAMREEGINKIALVAFRNNEGGNRFWEKMGYVAREDLAYRDKSLNPANG